MSKALEATCDANGIVTAEGFQVPSAVILSEGKAASEGLLILEEEKATYVAKTSGDLKTSIENMVSALDAVASALTTVANTLTAIGGGMTGSSTAPPPALPTNVSQINSKVSEIQSLKSEFESLKDALK